MGLEVTTIIVVEFIRLLGVEPIVRRDLNPVNCSRAGLEDAGEFSIDGSRFGDTAHILEDLFRLFITSQGSFASFFLEPFEPTRLAFLLCIPQVLPCSSSINFNIFRWLGKVLV